MIEIALRYWRTPVVLALGILVSSPANAASSCVGNGPAKLLVEATGLRSGAGEVAFTVYPDDRKRFLSKGGKLLRARVPARQSATAACFLLPPGYYAIALYHDENGDHDFNRTLFVPKEGFGFSNDAPTSVGLPAFKDARFQLPAGGAKIAIKTRYRR